MLILPPGTALLRLKVTKGVAPSAGFGSTSRIYKHTTASSKEVVAVKTFDEDFAEARIQAEINILSRMSHGNVIRFVGVTSATWPFSYATLLCEYGDLLNVFKHYSNDLKRGHLYQIMCDVSKGLSYLHSVLVSHNDIFQKNIVISKSFTTQIADFGQAEVFNSADGTKLDISQLSHLLQSLLKLHEDSPLITTLSKGDRSAASITAQMVSECAFDFFSCDQCRQLKNDHEALFSHRREDHHPFTKTCHICRGQFLHRNALAAHLKSHP